MSWRQVSATMAGFETTWGTPPAFTLMPTTSRGSKKRRHAPRVVASPVSARIPRSIISRTTSASTTTPASSRQRGERSDTTRPGQGPGMPGTAAGSVAADDAVGGRRVLGANGRGERRRGEKLQEGPAIHFRLRDGDGIVCRRAPGTLRATSWRSSLATSQRPAPRAPRVLSIDLLRGADVLLMLFVNEVAGVTGAPAFLLPPGPPTSTA